MTTAGGRVGVGAARHRARRCAAAASPRGLLCRACADRTDRSEQRCGGTMEGNSHDGVGATPPGRTSGAECTDRSEQRCGGTIAAAPWRLGQRNPSHSDGYCARGRAKGQRRRVHWARCTRHPPSGATMPASQGTQQASAGAIPPSCTICYRLAVATGIDASATDALNWEQVTPRFDSSERSDTNSSSTSSGGGCGTIARAAAACSSRTRS